MDRIYSILLDALSFFRTLSPKPSLAGIGCFVIQPFDSMNRHALILVRIIGSEILLLAKISLPCQLLDNSFRSKVSARYQEYQQTICLLEILMKTLPYRDVGRKNAEAASTNVLRIHGDATSHLWKGARRGDGSDL